MNVDEVFGETSCRTSAKMSTFKCSQILSQCPKSRTACRGERPARTCSGPCQPSPRLTGTGMRPQYGRRLPEPRSATSESPYDKCTV